MRMAITDRASADTSPLVFRIEHTSFDRLPPIGTEVCAIGNAGWKYLGFVIEHNADGVHYTVRITSAVSPRRPVLMSPADLSRKLQTESARTPQEVQVKKKISRAGIGLNNLDAISRMREIEQEFRQVSKVKHPCMIVVADATEKTLETAIVFIQAGTAASDAVSIAASQAGIHNAHEVSRIDLPDNFDARDHGICWDQPYVF